MRYSGIGGQAVMEGVMMKNGDRYAVAVRKPNQEISVESFDYKGIIKNETLKKAPLIRGVLNFIDSLVLGMRSLMYSASFFEDEEDSQKKSESEDSGKKENEGMGFTVALSVILAIGIFMVLPYYISLLFQRFIASKTVLAVVEGVIRLAIFVGYVIVISLMDDIKRVFMYHGAEHKCINCIEHGMELTVENVRKSSRQHKRCGTSFLLFVMIVSIIFFAFIQVDSGVLRLLLRLVLIPVIAGVSYEFIRLAGRSDNVIVNFLSKPGLWLQNLTTREPDDAMIEVGIASVEAVFDWKAYQEEEKIHDIS
ncbi:MAG: DUF1385 domain-containing protein [Lachnospiraceae bacterium]|nr:DUF1385 domain-containing protein [Lachnospiraceae bacterium]